jgi:hypothetical protein
VVVPGRGAAPQELLAVGPPEPRPRRELSPAVRAAALPALLVATALTGGLLVALSADPAPVASSAAQRAAAVQRVSAQAVPVTAPFDRLPGRFGVLVRVRPAALPGQRAPAEAGEAVSLLGLTAPGFDVSLDGSPAPRRVEVPGREPAEVVLIAQARVADCATASRTRGLALRVLGARGVEGSLWVRTPDSLVRSLQDLTRSTCRG